MFDFTRFFAATAVLGLCLTGCPGTSTDGGSDAGGQGSLQISELMASNRTTLEDEMGEFDDWLELTNTGDAAIDLSGWTLSDDTTEPDKMLLPSGVIVQPGDQVVLWIDSDPEQGPLHASFRLSRSGEDLVLSNDGTVVQSFFFGPQCPDVSFGVPSSGGALTFLATPTPGAPNSEARASAPECPDVEPDAGTPPDPALGVRLSEVAPAGTTGYPDLSGEVEAWLEIENPTDTNLELTDHILTTGGPPSSGWLLPDLVVPANGFLVVFLDGEVAEGNTHSSFSLAPPATLTLLAPDTTTTLSTLEVPELPEGQSYGLGAANAGPGILEDPTPAAPNSALATGGVDAGPSDGG